MDRQVESLVIGAGPAGLAQAACLKQRNLPFALIEQAATVGAAWRRHYDRLHLHTARDHSALPYLGFPEGTPRYPSRDQLIAYLEQYAQHFELAPHFGARAERVQCSDGEWTTTTTAGVYRSRHVVVATGYNAVPHVPHFPGQELFHGHIVHSSEYRNGEPFRNRSVLVIGLGNSGGEIAVDLIEHGARVAIAARRPLNIVPREILGIPIASFAIALGHLPARLADRLAAPLIRFTIGDLSPLGLQRPAFGPITQIAATSRIPLIDVGTVALIRARRIEVLGDVRSLSETTVSFADGTSRAFEAIVLATGYRSGLERFLEPAARQRSSTGHAPAPGSPPLEMRGLHFCGFRVVPSGMLRDIGFEARRIAERIHRARLSSTPTRP